MSAASGSAASHHLRPVLPADRNLATLTLGALGVVYGDIGTSPLYALRECFHGAHGIAPTRANVLGVLSLIFWSLTLVISIKYLVFVMRADNQGEGGILALLALVSQQPDGERAEPRASLIALGLFGAALLYGDGMITPAISVLSAVEGLDVGDARCSSRTSCRSRRDPDRPVRGPARGTAARRRAVRAGHGGLVRR